MNKELSYKIIDNKIDKIICNKYFNITNEKDFNNAIDKLISALKINKSKNLTLDLSHINFKNDKEYKKLYKIFNFLLTDTKIIKLNLSECYIDYSINNISYMNIITYLEDIRSKINKYDIYYNQQTDETINNLKSVLNNLELSKISNPINDIIYETFKSNKTLQTLNISNNSSFFDCLILKNLINSGNNFIKSLNLRDIKFNDFEYSRSRKLITQIINKNIITSLKLSFSLKMINYYSYFKNLLKSIKNNTSLKKLSIDIIASYIEFIDKNNIDILLLLLLKYILKNKSIKKLKIRLSNDNNISVNNISINTFNYLILNNKYLDTIIIENCSRSTNYLKLIMNDEVNINDNTNLNNYIQKYFNNIINIFNPEYNYCSDPMYKDIMNVTNNVINKDINLYTNIHNYTRFISDLYLINTKDYIKQIKEMDTNTFNKNYKDYYKQLQDKLNSTNIIIKD